MAQGSILIIEDEQDVQEVLAEIVELFGHRVKVLSDGLEAWKLLNKEKFDLIITDLGLPGMDGCELIRTIRANKITTPILVVAGVDYARADLDFEKIKLCDFIQKPFKINDIGNKISILLQSAANNLESVNNASNGPTSLAKRGR